MIGLEDRRSLARDIEEARQAGARLERACEVAAIDARTLQRWKAHDGLGQGDGRPRATRPAPAHALSPDARARLLRQSRHRGRAQAPRATRPPTTHVATAPGQVWCWDMTYLSAEVAGRWYYLYLILELYSRKIIGWEVHASDDADHAARLVQRTALAEGIAARAQRPVLHGDNGATLRATTVLAMRKRSPCGVLHRGLAIRTMPSSVTHEERRGWKQAGKSSGGGDWTSRHGVRCCSALTAQG